MKPILTVRNLTKTFEKQGSLLKKSFVTAIKSVSFTLAEGETLAIIGENGSGKSTLAQMIAGMIKPTSGDIWINEQKLTFGDYTHRSHLIRIILQDPENSFNPRQRVGQILEAPLKLNTDLTPQQQEKRIISTLKQVGLHPSYADYYPLLLATGQKQRIALARAMILQPKVIIADEALASIDITMRSQLINLLLELQAEHHISYIYVTQDLGMAKHISDNLMVMQDGNIVEYGNTAEVLTAPLSDITQRFIQSYFGEALTADTWRLDSSFYNTEINKD